MSELYGKVTKFDIFNVRLSRRTAYLLFLANEETDTSILPEPKTAEEEELYKLCLQHDGSKVAAKADASNIGSKASTDTSESWGEALGGGAVASGNKKLVTGGTVYTEARPASNGNYVQTAKTTAENIAALDAKLKEVADLITGSTPEGFAAVLAVVQCFVTAGYKFDIAENGGLRLVPITQAVNNE